jgi:hypothetical protein
MMKTLLVINDNTPQGNHAAKFAFLMAQKIQADIIIANICVTSNTPALTAATAGDADHNDHEIVEWAVFDGVPGDYDPKITEIDTSAMTEVQLAELTVKEDVWMTIKGMADHLPETLSKMHFNINILLNRSRCPLLLIPVQWHLKAIERLVYIADLRYCRLQFVRFLAELAKPFAATISIANLAAKGLPNMSEDYANTVFRDEICAHVKYEDLLLNNIRESDLTKAVDVMINGMHNDVLVMVNHRFHFEEIVGRYITEELPKHITVPLLIFPY